LQRRLDGHWPVRDRCAGEVWTWQGWCGMGDFIVLPGRGRRIRLLIANHAAANFKITLAKTSDDPAIQIPHVEGAICIGRYCWRRVLFLPLTTAPSQYNVNLVLRDADVQQITSPYQKDLKRAVDGLFANGWKLE